MRVIRPASSGVADAYDLLPWSAIAAATVEVESATHDLLPPTVAGASYRLGMTSTPGPWALSLPDFDLRPYMTDDGRVSMVILPVVAPLSTSDTSCFVGVWDGAEATVPCVGGAWSEGYTGSRSGEVAAFTMTPTTGALASGDHSYFDTLSPSIVCDHHWGPAGGVRRADARMSDVIDSVASQIAVAASRVAAESGGGIAPYATSKSASARTAADAPRLAVRLNGSAASVDSPEAGIWLLNVERAGLTPYSP